MRNGVLSMEDTICSVSTALGVGGIAIIRLSGNEAISIVNSIFKGKDLTQVASHTINYGHIVWKGKIIDEVLVSVMKYPKTYTMEDVVEVNIHGGIAVTNKVLEILFSSGCRQALPGEFTKRAFLNGRIDLTQAEAISDVVNAESENARSLSVNQLTGKLSSIIRSLKKRLLELESKIEVNIDYPEYEDIEDMTVMKVKDELVKMCSEVQKMIDESSNGKIAKSGIDVALVGRPNVGKSSILNFLLEEDRAIVTDIEGTTRDTVEGKIILNGNIVNFIDTAGIRDTENVVEKIGVDKSLKVLDSADVVVMVLNNGEKITDEEKTLLEKIGSKRHIVFVNKNDLETKLVLPKGVEAVFGNTVDDTGLDALKAELKKMFELEELSKKDFTYISNARQLSLIEKVKSSIASAIEAIENGMPVDVVEIDLSEARVSLGEILGEVYDDELIDELFSRFCLGK